MRRMFGLIVTLAAISLALIAPPAGAAMIGEVLVEGRVVSATDLPGRDTVRFELAADSATVISGPVGTGPVWGLLYGGADRLSISAGDRVLVSINGGNDIGEGPNGWFAQTVTFIEDRPGAPEVGQPQEYPATFPKAGWKFWGTHLAALLVIVTVIVLIVRRLRRKLAGK